MVSEAEASVLWFGGLTGPADMLPDQSNQFLQFEGWESFQRSLLAEFFFTILFSSLNCVGKVECHNFKNYDMFFKSTIDKSTELCPELSLWILSPTLFNPYIMLMWLFITPRFCLPYLWRRYNSLWLYCVCVCVCMKKTETERKKEIWYISHVRKCTLKSFGSKTLCIYLYMCWYIFVFSDILKYVLKTVQTMKNLPSLQNACNHIMKEGCRLQTREMK